MGSTGLNRVDRAHQMYRDGRYEEALSSYTDALSLANTTQQRIALHSNRAACFLKLHLFHKAAEECTSVLELDHRHTGALMLRAQTLVTLKEYHSALFDVNRLIELNPSSEVYKNLEARLKTQLSLAPIPELEEEEEEEEEDHGEAMAKEMDHRDLSGEKRSALAHQPGLQGQEPNGARSCTKEKEDTKEGWQAIPKPKGHTSLDYARWDRVEDSSSDDEDEDEEDGSECKYRFRVRTVGVRPVK